MCDETPAIMIENPITTNEAYQTIRPENGAPGILCRIATAARVVGEMRTEYESIPEMAPAKALSRMAFALTMFSSTFHACAAAPAEMWKIRSALP